MYISPLFRKARAFAEVACDRWFVISAKYGLVAPEAPIEPYDETLKGRSLSERTVWAERVLNRLRDHVEPNSMIIVLGGSSYSVPLVELLEAEYAVVATPMGRLSIGERLQWLNIAVGLGKKIVDLERFYYSIERLISNGQTFSLDDQRLVDALPRRGVYFLFEPGELRRNRAASRVVRVGTHAVSRNASSSLWGRLRTHRGTGDGRGSHRSSVFRLHVGRALQNGELVYSNISTWGHGATAERQIRDSEIPLESAVSAFIRTMTFTYVTISDQPGAGSDRSYIERNSVALLSTVASLVDRPSREWLGNASDRGAIQQSGLWNLNYVGEAYDPRFLAILERYVDITLGLASENSKSLAPPGWRNTRSDHQSSLF